MDVSLVACLCPSGSWIYGADPLDAITKALDFLSSLIPGSEDDGLVVWWQAEGDHAGLTC